mgnify:CR=1 FL=1
MQPFYTEQQTLLANTMREFASEKLAPLAHEVDETEKFPTRQFRDLADLGITGMTLPEEFGGSNGGYKDFMVVVEEIASACGSTSTVPVSYTHLTLPTKAEV